MPHFSDFLKTPFLGVWKQDLCYIKIADFEGSFAIRPLKKRDDEDVTHINRVFSLPRARVKVYIRGYLILGTPGSDLGSMDGPKSIP